METETKQAGHKRKKWTSAKVYKYQHTIINKTCIECSKSFCAIRRLKPICSETCKVARRRKFRPQTFKNCESCGRRFGPVARLAARFCSYACKVAKQRTGRRVTRKTIPKARAAQRMLAYHIQTGKILRPKECEHCGIIGKIEGAHFNYDEPLRVRWLCISCHVKWNKAEPKGATYRIGLIGPKFAF